MDAESEITLHTPRLTLRPLRTNDWQALSKRCGVAQVADNLLSLDAPWDESAVKDWISQYSWRGTPTYRLATCLKGDLIGAVGFAGRIKNFGFGYFLAPEHWGQGYATESARTFLADAFARFDIPAFNSAAFVRNVASHNILTKLGFGQVGDGMSLATATLEPEPELRYRLTQSQFKAANT